MPEFARQRAIFKLVPFAPPVIPDAPKILVRARLIARQFRRQQATDGQQARLKLKDRKIFAGGQTRSQFRQALHGPEVMFVAQCSQHAFRHGLFPAAWWDTHSHIPAARRFSFNLHTRSAKVRPRFTIPEARVKHSYGAPVQQPELIAAQALVIPDGLKQALRRRALRSFAKSRRAVRSDAPFRLRICCHDGHFTLLFVGRFRKAKSHGSGWWYSLGGARLPTS